MCEWLVFLSLIGDQLDRPFVVEHTAARVGDVPHSQADSALLRSLFPTISPVDFAEGLRTTIEWMKSDIERKAKREDRTAPLRASS